MKIALVTTEFVKDNKLIDGGIASHVYKIANSLAEMGDEVTVYYGPEVETFNHPIGFKLKNLTIKDNLVIKVLSKLLGRLKSKPFKGSYKIICFVNFYLSQYKRKLFVRAVGKKIEHEPVDVVHFLADHGISYYFKKFKIPYVSTICCQIKLYHSANEQKGWLYQLAEKRIYREIKQHKFCYTPSYLSADTYSKDLKLKTPMKVIETPFVAQNIAYDYTKFKEIKQEYNLCEFALYYGSIKRLKGVLELADAFVEIFKQDSAIKLVICGKDLKEKGQSNIALIKQKLAKHLDRVVFVDSLEHKELFPFIINSSLVILPSRNDNLPNTCIESMSCGKVVIGSRGASFDQLIKDGENGFLCQAGQAKSIVRSYERFKDLDQLEIERIQKNAIEAVQRLKPELVVKQVRDYYLQAIKG